MSKPTHDDAVIMLQLVRTWPDEATNWMWSDEFTADPEQLATGRPPERAHANIRAVLGWYETIGTLYKHGLINEDLLFDWLAIEETWDRMRNWALAWRSESGNPRMYENFEAMALAQQAWSREREAA